MWILYTTIFVLKTAPDIKHAEIFRENVAKHVEALIKVQRESGGFGTVLNADDSYVEASATAGIAAGIAMAADAGIVAREYKDNADRALDEVISYINDDGDVEHVSCGTPVCDNEEIYKNVTFEVMSYGQALTALALVELKRE